MHNMCSFIITSAYPLSFSPSLPAFSLSFCFSAVLNALRATFFLTFCTVVIVNTPAKSVFRSYVLEIRSHSSPALNISKMPFPALHRRHSWPPFKTLHTSFGGDDKIDDNPFAYFISPIEDQEAFVGSNLTAGITQRPRTRSLSPFHSQFHSSPLSTPLEWRPLVILRKLIRRLEARRHPTCRHPSPSQPQTRAPPPPDSYLKPPPSPASPPSPQVSPRIRGRRVLPSSEGSSRIRQGRSHSERPRIWREPGEDLWTLAEEGEEVGLGITT